MVRDMKRFTTSPVQMAVALTQTLTVAQTMAPPWILETVLSAQIWVLETLRRYGWTLTSAQRIQPSTIYVCSKIRPAVGPYGMRFLWALHRGRVRRQPLRRACGLRQFAINPPSDNGRPPINFLARVGCVLLDQRKCRFAEYLSCRLPEPVG